jgi:putative ABC transport system permease protein
VELIKLEVEDLIWALGMMVIAIGISSWQRLGLEKQLAISTMLTVANLLLVGYILAIVFNVKNFGLILAILLVMLAIATIVARNRIDKKLPGLVLVVGGSILVSTTLTLIYTNLLVLQPTKWYEPQYIIPLTGIVLGNAMNATALAGERLVAEIKANQQEIETHLSLGATPQQAIARYRQEAIRASLIPTLNSMMVVGVVSLPGMMTGQILSGVDPLNAAAYQILIMFMLSFTNLIAASLVSQGVYRRFFNPQAQLQV